MMFNRFCNHSLKGNPMRWIGFVGMLLVIMAASVHARTMYVNDVIKITVRTGPGISHKVIAMLQSGEMVEILEENDEWSRVRLQDGKEGWALTRFLTSKQPTELQLKALQDDYAEISQKLDVLKQENDYLKKENERIQGLASDNQTKMRDLETAYEDLRTGAADYLQIKSAYEETADALAEQRMRADDLATRVSKLEWKRNVMWFMGGAGVFLLGFLIGGLNEKGKRRKSVYY